MNVILTGMRGSGKSSIGRVLAELIGFSFVDTDTLIEALAASRIADLVAQYGWDHFRALERRVVKRVAAGDKQVIAVGGGTVIDADNAARLKSHGLVILLWCEVAILQRRIAAGTNRPSLRGQTSAVEELQEVWEQRRTRYRAVADLMYDVSDESEDWEHDVHHKATAIRAMLRQIPDFRDAVAST